MNVIDRQPSTITFEITVDVDTAGLVDDVRADITERVERALKGAGFNADVEDIGVDYPDGKCRDALERCASDLLAACEALVADLINCRPLLPSMEARLTAAASTIAKAKGGAR